MYNLPNENYLIFNTDKTDKDNYRSFVFIDPVDIIVCDKLKDVYKCFNKIEHYISNGYYAAGFVSYEAGFAFDGSVLKKNIQTKFPLIWFGIFNKPFVFKNNNIPFIETLHNFSINNLYAGITKKTYIKNIKAIKHYIERGDTYQVNYTFKYRFNFEGSSLALYNNLRDKQRTAYSAYIKIPEFTLISVSPELFFRKHGNNIEVKPMKGTIAKGKNIEETNENAKILKKSIKDRSENIMIVDLLRNDLARICEPKSVKAYKLFEIEEYETLLQMVSNVKGKLKKNISIYDLFKNIFPSGSIAGAPKINTMKIIDTLEQEPRGIYTGSIGFISPKKEAVFNVAIRTLLIDNKTNKGEMGVGSGIVYDSIPLKEFEECSLKAKFLLEKQNDFCLIETILWKPVKSYFLLKLHIQRLKSSAEYFNFSFNESEINSILHKTAANFDNVNFYKVRLLLYKNGDVSLEYDKIQLSSEMPLVIFSKKHTDSNNVFLYHKTTNRELYSKEYKECIKKGYFDVIFKNEKNQITEGAITNIIIKKGRYFYTPPVECGLLYGVYLKNFVSKHRALIKEKILYEEDILNADKVYMANSVRGMVQVKAVISQK